MNPKKKICTKCGGMGVIDRDDKLYECECERIRRIAFSMPVHIRRAIVEDAHIVHSLVDEVKKDCYVIAAWVDMKAIIKIAMIKHWPRYIRITSDAEIRNVFVGGKSKNAQMEGYEGEIYNNLQDFMDPPELMIVRLGELSYKNRAAAGALEEAISYRLDRAKPTWVLSNVDQPFTLGSHAYSKSVEDLFRTAFKQVHVPRIATQVVMQRLDNAVINVLDIYAEPAPKSSTPDVLLLEPAEGLRMPGSPSQIKRSQKTSNTKPERPKYTRIQSVPDGEPDSGDSILNSIGSGVKKQKFQRRE